MYPKEDNQYEEATITSVETTESGGWAIGRDDGWSFWVPPESTITPKIGMKARFYGEGIGKPVRGLFLAGKRVFYRTEKENKEYHEIQLYGKDAEDWLKRWDAGDTVWSIEMGGLGPGYEQAIQVTAAEILRHLLAERYDTKKWEDTKVWEEDRKSIEDMGFKNTTIAKMGLSGAQWWAAMNVAIHLYREGPRHIMGLDKLKDRKIQVSRNFPSV